MCWQPFAWPEFGQNDGGKLLQRTNQGERQPCADEKQMPARFKAECGGYLSDESGNE